MPLPHPYKLAPYSTKFAHELVVMWRESFETAVGVKDANPIEEQIEYLQTVVVSGFEVVLVLDTADNVVAFIAYNTSEINQLYVHRDHQGKGIGRALLQKAIAESDEPLTLYTFESNVTAQRFYEKHGFEIVERGFEETWQLADIKYRWDGVV